MMYLLSGVIAVSAMASYESLLEHQKSQDDVSPVKNEEMIMSNAGDNRNKLLHLEHRLRTIEKIVKNRDVDPKYGVLINITKLLMDEGFSPQYAALTYPEKYKMPNKVYISIMNGKCSGLLIAATADYGETKSYVSVLPIEGDIIYTIVIGPVSYKYLTEAVDVACSQHT